MRSEVETPETNLVICFIDPNRWEVELDLDNTITCNCSRCQKMGFVLAFSPQESFHLKSGEAALTEYLI